MTGYRPEWQAATWVACGSGSYSLGAAVSANDYFFRAGDPVPDPDEAEFAQLVLLRKRFRRHHIFRDVIPGRGVRYLAHGRVAGVRPHTVITDDLAELGEVLEHAALGETAARSPDIHG